MVQTRRSPSPRFIMHMSPMLVIQFKSLNSLFYFLPNNYPYFPSVLAIKVSLGGNGSRSRIYCLHRICMHLKTGHWFISGHQKQKYIIDRSNESRCMLCVLVYTNQKVIHINPILSETGISVLGAEDLTQSKSKLTSTTGTKNC